MSKTITPGNYYHVIGWNPGAFFRLVRIEGQEALLEYPKRKKRLRVPLDSLQNIKAQGRAKSLRLPGGKK